MYIKWCVCVCEVMRAHTDPTKYYNSYMHTLFYTKQRNLYMRKNSVLAIAQNVEFCQWCPTEKFTRYLLKPIKENCNCSIPGVLGSELMQGWEWCKAHIICGCKFICSKFDRVCVVQVWSVYDVTVLCSDFDVWKSEERCLVETIVLFQQKTSFKLEQTIFHLLFYVF